MQDKELERQLESAKESETPLAVAFALKRSGVQITPEETEERVNIILVRAKAKTGLGYENLRVFKNLASFVLTALPEFIIAIMMDDDVHSATANQQIEDLLLQKKDIVSRKYMKGTQDCKVFGVGVKSRKITVYHDPLLEEAVKAEITKDVFPLEVEFCPGPRAFLA
jgi:hypothetical protein